MASAKLSAKSCEPNNRPICGVTPSMEKLLKLPLTGLDLSFESHEASGFPKLPALCNGGPTIPQVHYYHNDVAVYARFCYSLGGGFRRTLGASRARLFTRA